LFSSLPPSIDIPILTSAAAKDSTLAANQAAYVPNRSDEVVIA